MKAFLILPFILPIMLLAQTKPQAIRLNPAKIKDLITNISADSTYDLETTGKDPYIFTEPLVSAIEKELTIFSFEYFCPTGLDFISLNFYPEEKSIKPIRIRDVGSTEGWVEFTIDVSEKRSDWGQEGDELRLGLGAAPNLQIQIRNLQIRTLSGREKVILAQKEALKAQEKILEGNLKTYLKTSFPNEITSVSIEEDKVVINGKVKGSGLKLAEVTTYQHVTELKEFVFTTDIPSKENGSFNLVLDRIINRSGFQQDRLHSKWVIIDKSGKLASHARYTDTVVPKYDYPFVKPSTKKGIGGYSAGRAAPMSDLDDLGITSATVNIWINQFLMSEQSDKTTDYEYLGKIYYMDKKAVEKMDKTILSTADRNIEVSAILLVAKASGSPDKTIGKILQHPDCDPAGIYSMPNVTDAEGVQFYSAMLDFLASRYSRPDKKYGRIHHWIIHNEVDAGWVWTNAGEKTALVFMDLYYKSMRMSHNIARKYNRNSKVFISLTHYWNWTSNPHFYHSKELLEQLLQFSKAEGDFDWAIAQHPYPESLREPKTWLDNKVSFDFDTQLITFKNTEVLDAWVKLPEVLYKGKHKRLVYLSENGTNSPTYSKQDLAEQAAGMAYALKKIKYLDGIDGFQYHNWQDNRREGGLRIGLRRFPDDEEDPTGVKPVWHVYQAFEEENENEVFDRYKEMIGIKEWDEIRYKGEITAGKKKQKFREIHSDTWVANDALGRSLPTYDECGPRKKDRYVGMFYFLTHNNSNSSGPFNVTEIIKKNPDNPKWGLGSHYWGEPEIGYYLNHEEWAIRRHAYQLSEAGVDVIILDVTNNKTYPDTYLNICKVFDDMRKGGERTPDIAFLGSEISVNKLWQEFYSKGLYENLWFQWKNKPLLLYGQHEVPGRNKVNDIVFSDEINEFFNMKQSWAWTSLPWYNDGKDEWPWVDHFPQAVSWDQEKGDKEMIPVASGQHPLSNIGRSFHNFHQPETNEYDLTSVTDQGLHFQEQWDRALKVDPEFVFVTGWNEWSAGRQTLKPENISKQLQRWAFYPGAHLGKVGEELKPGDVYFIDQYNQEFSRDIEPMKGGHTDNYYYQLMANIRKYKGVTEPITAQKSQSIDINGNLSQWDSIEAIYYDHVGDVAHRSSQKQGTAGPYVNTQGRNDILESRVVHDNDNFYFYVNTVNPITPTTDPNWMYLLIDTDQNKATGWEGYDFLVNHSVFNQNTTSIKKHHPKKGWVEVNQLKYKVDGQQLMISIPRSLVGKTKDANIEFHWVDNPKKLENINDLFSAGDNAPSRRANYQYLGK